MSTAHTIHIGCAGWSIPSQSAGDFPGDGTHLERYARTLTCTEINSTFYRRHGPDTFARWADSVPEKFRFSVKAPREITHQRKLIGAGDALRAFIGDCAALRQKAGPTLFQLPPSLWLAEDEAARFFAELRAETDGEVVLEPRNASWFTPAADELLTRFRIARAAADPPRDEAGCRPAGWRGITYIRLHGSPRVYYAEYGPERIGPVAAEVRAEAAERPCWIIFDNTAAGAAIRDAQLLTEQLAPGYAGTT